MSRIMPNRRRFLALSLAGFAFALAGPAWAGSYLDRVALLIQESDHDSDFLRARLSDRELARLIHEVAAARVSAASTMLVPKEVANAHPHVLLVLENHERAANAAKEGNAQRFLVFRERARDEERILRGVLKELGFPLPDK
jgi:hypothetical protein